MAYNKFSVYDFVFDESFKKWVDNPYSEDGLVWEKWVQENPDQKEIIQEARELVLSLDLDTPPLSHKEVDGLWQKLEQRIDKKNSALTLTNHEQVETNHFQFKNYSRWAAGFVAFLLINLSVYFVLDYVGTHTYVTDYGEQKTFLLPDGSTAILNANSTLKYKSGLFMGGLREVWLNGEAFFSVVPTPNKERFLVHTAGLGVEVLGTEFNVKQREVGGANIVLTSGKIVLRLPDNFENGDSKNAQEVIMKPGEMVEYSNEDKILTKNKVDTEKYLAWSQNKLVFDNTPLEEIVRLLEDNYGYKVILQKKEWNTKTFTATYPADQIEILLLALSKSFSFSISQKGNTLYLVQNDTKSP